MARSVVIESQAEYDQMLESTASAVIVVDVHMAWCGPCRAALPTFNQLKLEHGESIVFAQASVDAVQSFAPAAAAPQAHHGSQSQAQAQAAPPLEIPRQSKPFFVLLKGGEVLGTVNGLVKHKLVDLVHEGLARRGSVSAPGARRGSFRRNRRPSVLHGSDPSEAVQQLVAVGAGEGGPRRRGSVISRPPQMPDQLPPQGDIVARFRKSSVVMAHAALPHVQTPAELAAERAHRPQRVQRRQRKSAGLVVGP